MILMEDYIVLNIIILQKTNCYVQSYVGSLGRASQGLQDCPHTHGRGLSRFWWGHGSGSIVDPQCALLTLCLLSTTKTQGVQLEHQ